MTAEPGVPSDRVHREPSRWSLPKRAMRSIRNRRRQIARRLRARVWRLGNPWLLQGAKRLEIGHGVDFDIYGTLIIGRNVRLSDGVAIEVGPRGTLEIGDDVFVGRHTVLVAAERVRIGSEVLIAEHCSIRDGDHALAAEERRHERKLRTASLEIGSGVWIGAGARILRGACVGDGAVVAANSVVKDRVEPHCIVAGSPARVVRSSSQRP